jgi:hypothetical protein
MEGETETGVSFVEISKNKFISIKNKKLIKI